MRPSPPSVAFKDASENVRWRYRGLKAVATSRSLWRPSTRLYGVSGRPLAVIFQLSVKPRLLSNLIPPPSKKVLFKLSSADDTFIPFWGSSEDCLSKLLGTRARKSPRTLKALLTQSEALEGAFLFSFLLLFSFVF